jgi:hypothetical protein
MMKNMLMACFAAGIALAGIAGCSDDAPTQVVEGTQYLKFKEGDQFHYEVYDRDTNNVRITSSMKMQHWTVIDTGAPALGGQSVGITVFEVTTDGATEKDTMYLQSRSDGVVQMYDVLGSMVSRFAIGESIGASVPKQWVKISDTKSPGALTWESTGDAIFSVATTIGGFPVNAQVTLTMDASHKGKQSAQGVDSTFANSFHTDHVLKVAATDPTFGNVLVADSSAINIHYDVDINAGIVKQTLDSRTVTLTPSVGGPIPQPVTGFEMILKSYTRN